MLRRAVIGKLTIKETEKKGHYLATLEGETLGILGVALLRAPVAAASGQDVLGGVWLGAVAVALAGVLGLLIAGSIARPLRVMAEAANRASDGDLEAFVPEGGRDEIGMLGRSFNRLLDGLRHKTLGSRLGRESPAPAAPTEPRLGAASRPEAPAASRLEVDAGSPPGPPGAAPETAEAFAPQRVQAALLYAEVRDEGVAAENAEPRALLETIKQYVSAAEAIVAKHGGELIRFEGGVLVACFGVRPRPLPSPVSALQATHAGVTLIDLFRSLNQRRHAAGQRKLAVSIGVTSGTAVAGTVQAAGRSQLALLGEVTLIARRVQQVAREFGESGLLIDEATFQHLGGAQRQFSLGRYGRVQPGAGEKTLTVYEVKGRTAQLVDPAKPV